MRLPDGVRPGGRADRWHPPRARYVVCDVDGTLLGVAPEAADAVVDALVRARDAGLAVGFATGRMRAAVEPLWRRAPIDGPHILHNGAEVRVGGTTVGAWPLPTDGVRRLLDLCADGGWYAELYVGDGYVVTDRRPEAAVHWAMLHRDPDGTADDLDLDRDEVLKASVLVFDGPATAVTDALSGVALAAGVATSPHAPGVSFVNVTRPDVDKGTALRFAAAHLGVDLGTVVAVGDGDNDLPMLAVAGTAIAMGQAPEPVRAAAHLVVPEVDVDGVVHALDAAVGWAGGQSPPGTW